MSRQLIVCLDGTYNTPKQLDRGAPASTNVCKLAVALTNAEPRRSVRTVKYLSGVGHGSTAAIGWLFGLLNRITAGKLDHLFGGLSGWGLSQQIRDGYRFLVEEYVPGDQIYIFGFSRGAFAARSLVGLIKHAGLLKKEAQPLIRRVTKAYHRLQREPKHREFIASLRTQTHPDVRVYFLGVWDTVDALGVPIEGGSFSLNPRKINPRFHDVNALEIVDAAFHALAIDELRTAYSPVLFVRTPACTTRLEQVWFRGVHCDIGGGYSDATLSDVTLRWMVEGANEFGLGLCESDLHLSHLNPCTAEPRDSVGLMWVAGVWPRAFPTARVADDYSPDRGYLHSSVDEIHVPSDPLGITDHWLLDLEPGDESPVIDLPANKFWTNTRLVLRQGESYVVRILEDETWHISGDDCGADGVPDSRGSYRDPAARKGELILTIGAESAEARLRGKFWNAIPYLLHIKLPPRASRLIRWTSLDPEGNGRLLKASCTGVLHGFANSKVSQQSTNSGSLTLQVTRIATVQPRALTGMPATLVAQ